MQSGNRIIRSLKLNIPNVFPINTAHQWTNIRTDAMTLVHEKFEAKGMEPTGKKASVLEIMGLAGHLGHVCFNFYFCESQPVG